RLAMLSGALRWQTGSPFPLEMTTSGCRTRHPAAPTNPLIIRWSLVRIQAGPFPKVAAIHAFGRSQGRSQGGVRTNDDDLVCATGTVQRIASSNVMRPVLK